MSSSLRFELIFNAVVIVRFASGVTRIKHFPVGSSKLVLIFPDKSIPMLFRFDIYISPSLSLATTQASEHFAPKLAAATSVLVADPPQSDTDSAFSERSLSMIGTCSSALDKFI